MRNFKALRQLRDKLVFDRPKHDQNSWASFNQDRFDGVVMKSEPIEDPRSVGGTYVTVNCTTSACAAGWAVQNAGDMMLYDPDCVKDGYAESTHCLDGKGKIHYTPTRAMKLLGITKGQANVLFNGDTTTPQVVEMLDILLKEDLSNSDAKKQLKEYEKLIGVEEFFDTF